MTLKDQNRRITEEYKSFTRFWVVAYLNRPMIKNINVF